ncbi:hypothetical protein HQ46_06270 [Porphyromonas gulae]|uniref:Uncharacterized protein n=1 Tax=Porphyromonas gulae TaxID=111105 RepID=A0A0A2FFX7_9PORP|nr:hypothetical protein HR08_02160 [Porphyromonas gulae]KGN89027.1 hypothetical protein HQ46_06270 [Porphyromonas gulae]
MLEKLVRNRRIAKSKNCRVKYGNPKDFKTLQVRITHEDTVYTYEIDSEKLSVEKDSIHFYPKVISGELFIRWDQETEENIKLISKD